MAKSSKKKRATLSDMLVRFKLARNTRQADMFLIAISIGMFAASGFILSESPAFENRAQNFQERITSTNDVAPSPDRS